MKMLRSVMVTFIYALLGAATSGAAAAENLNLIYNGVAIANTRPTPDDPAFADWCRSTTGTCFPTVHQSVYDMATGQKKGEVYIWGAFPFHATPSYPAALCFSEFMVFTLNDGDVTVHTGPDGTCGAFMDPSIKPPLAAFPLATAVVAGGGDGVISGGTGRYSKWAGTFTDRVFVGFGAPTSGVGGIIYYDQLIFSIFGK